MKKSKVFIAIMMILAVGFCAGWIFAHRDWSSGPECVDGTRPDADGCCAGEVYTDMGEQGFNCCPEKGGDCFPPIK